MNRKKPKPPVAPLQRWTDRQAAALLAGDMAVLTPEMESKGTYNTSIHPSQGKRYVNNHSAWDRWIAQGKLTQEQIVAGETVMRLWRLAGLQQRLTASYGERTAPSSGYEDRGLAEIQARKDLHRIQGYFSGSFMAFWNIFENVCRHQIAAGIAGGDERTGSAIALFAVKAVADKIAEMERL